MSKGIVYVLTNKAMPDIVKIGKTSRGIESRLKELYNTSVPYPFECAYAVECEDMDKVESTLHDSIFYDSRVNRSREFFAVEVDKVVALLSLLGKDVTKQTRMDIEEVIPQEEKELSNGEYSMVYRGSNLVAVKNTDGTITVKKGGIVPGRPTVWWEESSTDSQKEMWNELEAKDLDSVGDHYVLNKDVVFRSFNEAACVLTRSGVNALYLWRDKDGLSLNDKSPGSYWGLMDVYFENTPSLSNILVPKTLHSNWKSFAPVSSRHRGYHYEVDLVRQEGDVRVEIYIPDDKSLYQKCLDHKDVFDDIFGEDLEWKESRMATRISVHRTTNFNDVNDVDKSIEWAFDMLVKLDRAMNSI